MTADTISPETTSAADRMAAALRAPGTLYTAEQVAWIIALDRNCRDDDPDDPGFRDLIYRSGFEAGYQARVAEENADYRLACEQAEADPSRTDLRQMIETVDARRSADRAARLPRPGDFRGGLPVPGRLDDHDPEKEAA